MRWTAVRSFTAVAHTDWYQHENSTVINSWLIGNETLSGNIPTMEFSKLGT